MAPEILNDAGYSLKSDIFSLGSVMYNLITGKYLFAGATSQELMIKNKQCDLTEAYEQVDSVSRLGKDLLMKLLDVNPELRYSASEALNHPWFASDREALQEGLLLNNFLCDHNVKRFDSIHSNMLNNCISDHEGFRGRSLF